MKRAALAFALAGTALGPAFAAGPKGAGSVSVRDDFLAGAAAGVRQSAGTTRMSGSIGQAGPPLSAGGVVVQSGFYTLSLVPPDPAEALSAAQNATLRTSSSAWLGASWTAPGENAAVGNLQPGAFYDLRWSTVPLADLTSYEGALFRSTFSAAGTPPARLLAAFPGAVWHFGHTTVNSAGMRSEVAAASAAARELRVQMENTAPPLVFPGTRVTALKLRAWGEYGTANWRTLGVAKEGSLADAALNKVALYRDDNGDGVLDAADPQVTADAAFAAGRATLSLSGPSGEAVGGGTKTYFLAVSLAAGAAAGTTAAIRLDGQAIAVEGAGAAEPDYTGLSLDGAGARAAAPYAAALNLTTALTLEAWVQTLAASGRVVSRSDQATKGFGLGLGGACAAGVPGFDTGGTTLCGPGPVNDGRWHHLAAVHDAAQGRRLFVDGLPVAAGPAAGSLFDDASGLAVGASTGAGGGFLDGDIDEVRVSRTARYAAAFLPAARFAPDADTVALYHFDPGEAASGLARDASATLNHAAVLAGAGTGGSSGVMSVSGPGLVFVAAASSAPATAVQGTSGIPMLSLALWTDQGSADASRVDIARTGTAGDADVAAVRLYVDDGDGTLEPAADLLLATAAFTGGTAALSFSARTVTTATQTWLVAYDLSSIAGVGATVGASIGSPGSVTVAPPYNVAPAGFPASSAATLITPTQNGVSVSFQDKAPASLPQGATAQLMIRLLANTTSNDVRLDSLTLERLGTASDADIARLRVYRDEGDGLLGAGDQELASVANPFLGGRASVGLLPAPKATPAGTGLLVAVDVAALAEHGRTFGVRVASSGAVAVPVPNYVVNAGFPMDTFAVPIAKTPEAMTLLAVPVLGDLNQGAEGTAFRVLAWSALQRVTWTAVRFQKSGTLADAGVREVRVYRDMDGDQALGAADILVGTGTFAGGLAAVTLSSAQTVTPASGSYLAALALQTNAAVGATIGLAIQDASFLTVAAPDSVSSANLPAQTALATVLDPRTPTRPVVSLPDGNYSAAYDSVRFVWSSTVAAGSIVAGEYAVGTAPEGTQTAPWTAFPPGLSEFTATGLSLQSGATYYVSVRARSDSGFQSPAGSSSWQLLDRVTPGRPVLAAQANSNAVVLNWGQVTSGPSGIKGYLAEYRTGESPLWRNMKTGAATAAVPAAVPAAAELTNPPFATAGIPSGTLYFRVRAVSNANLTGEPSEPVKVQLGPLPKDAISGVSAYPNPFDSRKRAVKIVYSLPADAAVELKIFDVFGNKVTALAFSPGGPGGTTGTNEVSWDGTDESGRKVSMGAYIAVIRSGGARAVHKIGVIH